MPKKRNLPLKRAYHLLEPGPVILLTTVKDVDMVERYHFFVLEVVKALVDSSYEDPCTLHHWGYGWFMMAGPTMALPWTMRQGLHGQYPRELRRQMIWSRYSVPSNANER